MNWRYVRFWRHLIGIAAVFVCGGLVGPIFLGEYFLTSCEQDDPTCQQGDLTWMLVAGTAVTAGSVALGVVAGHFIGKGVDKLEQSQERRARLQQRGVLALAQVTGYAETGMSINDRPVVRVSLHVEGRAPFDTEVRLTVGLTAMPILAARRVVVLADPAMRDCEIDLQASALVSGVMPMQLAVAEDERTYDITGQAGPVMEILQVLRANGIPFGGNFDLRSNPVVRDQVVEILRRNAAEQQAVRPGAPQFSPSAATQNTGPAWMPPQPPPSAAQRLQELETLRATGAITESEYAAKRQQVIAEL
jgi:Short C-terminal domain